MHHFVDVDVEFVVFAPQGVPEGGDVGLTGSAGGGGHGAVDLVCAGLDGGEVTHGSDAGGFVRVENQFGFGGEHFASHGDGFVNLLRGGSSGGIFEADAIEFDTRIENSLQGFLVEGDIVRAGASGR